MTKTEIQDKLEFIVRSHDTIAVSNGYKAATDMRVAYFHDLVRMIETLLENTDGTLNIREVGTKTNRGSGSTG